MSRSQIADAVRLPLLLLVLHAMLLLYDRTFGAENGFPLSFFRYEIRTPIATSFSFVEGQTMSWNGAVRLVAGATKPREGGDQVQFTNDVRYERCFVFASSTSLCAGGRLFCFSTPDPIWDCLSLSLPPPTSARTLSFILPSPLSSMSRANIAGLRLC